MTRDDLARFRALDIDFESIGLLQDGGGSWDDFAYFCTPLGAEFVGRIGCDGVHFVLLPGDERVFCVDPGADEGQYVLPVGSDFREFLSFVLYSGDANPVSQLRWLPEERFPEFAAEDAAARAQGDMADYFAAKDAACEVIARTFGIVPAEPYRRVKALQADFDPSGLDWSDEYYDVLGLENPRRPEETVRVQGVEHTATFTFEMEVPPVQDPYILLSLVNTKLRDQYPSLDALCDDLNGDRAALIGTLAGAGYVYDSAQNRFVPAPDSGAGA